MRSSIDGTDQMRKTNKPSHYLASDDEYLVKNRDPRVFWPRRHRKEALVGTATDVFSSQLYFTIFDIIICRSALGGDRGGCAEIFDSGFLMLHKGIYMCIESLRLPLGSYRIGPFVRDDDV